MKFIIMNQSLVETFNSAFNLKAEWVETGKKCAGLLKFSMEEIAKGACLKIHKKICEFKFSAKHTGLTCCTTIVVV